MDTVFPDGTVKERPFSVQGDRAYGPGVSDMKCGCLQATHVLKAMEANDSLKDLKVCLAFNSEEERGSNNTRAWLEKIGSHTKYCLVLESARASGARVLTRKGLLHYIVDFNGKAAHAGNNHKDGRSAINEMAYWILQLAALTNYETGLTVNAGVCSGGTVYNSVAAYAQLDLDVRIADKAQIPFVEAALAKLSKHAEAAEIAVNIITRVSRRLWLLLLILLPWWRLLMLPARNMALLLNGLMRAEPATAIILPAQVLPQLTALVLLAQADTAKANIWSLILSNRVEKDIYMLTPMVGVKTAVSDHRSSNPQAEDLIALGTAARRGGMISGTAGIVVMHMGSGKGGLKPLLKALEDSDIPAKTFLPTHILRCPELIDDATEHVRRGGYIDCTAGSVPQSIEENADSLYELLQRLGVTLEHVTLSSDSMGSMPRFDDKGNCIGLTYATPDSLHKTIKGLVQRGMALEKAILLLTSNSAYVLGKDGVKGCIQPSADADLLVLDGNLDIDSLFAKGQTALLHGDLKMRGRFE